LWVAGILLAGAAWEWVASAWTKRRFPPPGRLIDIGGRRLHLHYAGNAAGPTVIIETGRFNTSAMWTLVHDQVKRFARVCSYDRAGYAWSDSDREPRTGERVCSDLEALLAAADIPGPYLLVGHSLGTMYVRRFAQLHPEQVAGIILVDPYTEGEFLGATRAEAAQQVRFLLLFRAISRIGIPRLVVGLARGMAEMLTRFPAPERRRIITLGCSHQLWRAVDAEWRQLDGLVCQLGGPGSLGDIPLLVLRSCRCDIKPSGQYTQAMVDARWRLMKDAQAALIHLSSRGHLTDLPNTGHGVPLENPEAVVAAIKEMIGPPE